MALDTWNTPFGMENKKEDEAAIPNQPGLIVLNSEGPAVEDPKNKTNPFKRNCCYS